MSDYTWLLADILHEPLLHSQPRTNKHTPQHLVVLNVNLQYANPNSLCSAVLVRLAGFADLKHLPLRHLCVARRDVFNTISVISS